MFIRLFFAIVFVAFLSGCATTQQKTSSDQLQNRVVELEKKLEEKDSEIVDLQYEVKDLHSKVENNKVVVPAVTESTTAVADEKPVDDKVIKVNVSASKVQSALKNAGYYTGKVDGKVGPGTKAAIAAFQKAQGLSADGVVGRKTWDALKEHLK